MNRHRARDDLLAAADALIASGVTAPDRLLGRTASAGGLAFGAPPAASCAPDPRD